MKRKFLLPFFLALVFCISAVPVSASGGTDVAIFKSNGQMVSSVVIEGGAVTMPSAPITTGVFVGWTATVNGETILLPEGATLDGLVDDVTFEAVSVSFATSKKSSVRLRDGFVALRFTSDIVTADYERLATLLGGGDKISFGTYIVPSKYVTYANKVFTLEAMAAKGVTQYIDVPAGDFYKIDNGVSTVAGSVGNIRKGNYTLSYTGRGYMKLIYTNGETRTLYAAYEYSAHSMTDVVLAAYNDRNESYSNLIVEPSGSTHSPYTNTQLQMCREFLDQIVMIEHDAKYQFAPFSTGYYVSPWKISQSEHDEYGRCLIYCAPPDGKSIDSAMGIYLDGRIYKLAWTRVENGRFVIDWDDYSQTTG